MSYRFIPPEKIKICFASSIILIIYFIIVMEILRDDNKKCSLDYNCKWRLFSQRSIKG